MRYKTYIAFQNLKYNSSVTCASHVYTFSWMFFLAWPYLAVVKHCSPLICSSNHIFHEHFYPLVKLISLIRSKIMFQPLVGRRKSIFSLNFVGIRRFSRHLGFILASGKSKNKNTKTTLRKRVGWHHHNFAPSICDELFFLSLKLKKSFALSNKKWKDWSTCHSLKLYCS